jgi:hypothetical protein
MPISHGILIRMRNFQIKVVEKIRIHFLEFFFENLAGKEIMSKYTVKSEATGVSMAAPCMLDLVRLYARKQTPAHPQPHTCSPYALPRVYLQKYVIPIAFPRQQWFVNAPECYILHTLPVLFVKLPGFAHLSW